MNFNNIKSKLRHLLIKSEKYTKTDMVYLAKGGFWLTNESLFSSCIAFILSLAFANLISQNTFATYKYVLSIAGILAIFTLPGMEKSILISISNGKNHIIPAIQEKLRWSFLSIISSLLVSLYYFIQGNQILGALFIVLALFLSPYYSFTVYSSILTGQKRFKEIMVYSLIDQLINGFFLLPTLMLTDNIIIILFVFFLPQSISRFLMTKKISKKITGEKALQDEIKKTIHYGKHLTIINSMTTLSANIDKILLWHFFGPLPVAIFSIAQAPVIQIKSIFKKIKTLAFPKLSQADYSTMQKTLPKKLLIMYLVIIPTIILYMLFAPLAFKIFFPQYMDSVIYSQIFSTIILFIPPSFIYEVLIAHQKKRSLYKLESLTQITKISLFFILIPLYGIWGVIMSILSVSLVKSVISIYIFIYKK